MKYMGSKRAMLRNGLGELVLSQTKRPRHFLDLFSGSAAVSWFVAQKTSCTVTSSDLQRFSAYLAEAVIGRERVFDHRKAMDNWRRRAYAKLARTWEYKAARAYSEEPWERMPRRATDEARLLCEAFSNEWPIARAYGGHYFSPTQALELEALRQTAEDDRRLAAVCIASVVMTASACSASPGHTAQPLQPTTKGASHLFEAWRRDVFMRVADNLFDLSQRHASAKGRAVVGDAHDVAATAARGDIAFVDPPYSAVHYSRFYHVLEALAQGNCSPVSGTGRYPPRQERPTSAYSNRSTARTAIEALLEILAEREVSVILTFPRDRASNGLAGTEIKELAERAFRVKQKEVAGSFSTLGARSRAERGRVASIELILLMEPRLRRAAAVR